MVLVMLHLSTSARGCRVHVECQSMARGMEVEVHTFYICNLFQSQEGRTQSLLRSGTLPWYRLLPHSITMLRSSCLSIGLRIISQWREHRVDDGSQEASLDTSPPLTVHDCHPVVGQRKAGLKSLRASANGNLKTFY